MRRRRSVAVVVALAALPLLMAPSGGFPSRPRFQAVGVGAAAPASGSITANGTVTADTVAATSTMTVGGAAVATAASVVPPPIECTAACDLTGIAVGQSAIIRNGAQTTINSTVALTANSVFSFTNGGENHYSIDGCLQFSGTPGSMGAKFAPVDQASGGADGGVMKWTATVNAVASSGTVATDVQIATFATISTTANANHLCFDGFVDANNSTFGVYWAQGTSDAGNLTIAANKGWYRVTRIL